MASVVVLDANVLVPNALCDLLLRLAEQEVYQPRWSDEILDEVRRHVPVEPAAIDRRIRFMNAAFEEALVTGYEYLIDQMANQAKDRHVLAGSGGVRCRSDRCLQPPGLSARVLRTPRRRA